MDLSIIIFILFVTFLHLSIYSQFLFETVGKVFPNLLHDMLPIQFLLQAFAI